MFERKELIYQSAEVESECFKSDITFTALTNYFSSTPYPQLLGYKGAGTLNIVP